MRRPFLSALTQVLLLVVAVVVAGCPTDADYEGTEAFPREQHSLLPPAPSPFSETAEPWHLGAGKVTGVGPEQPIWYSHYTHVTKNGMECQYCHQSARKSIHAGVPQTETCMNCHKYVKTDTERIQKLTEFYNSGEPIPWKKVHDLPDFVHFSHKRHVKGGVGCTECHGQMGLQGQEGISNAPVVRETTMQMGWCLDCHASHPSIDKNYGDKANLRRAELKDCWTCHK